MRATARLPVAAAVAVAALIFVVDTFTPLGVAEWVFYLVPILIVANRSSPRAIYAIAALCTALIVLGFFYSPPGIDALSGATNRLIQIAVLWLVALLLTLRRQLYDRLHAQQEQLEEQVRSRTSALQQELAERQLVEDALRLSEDKFAKAFYANPIAMSITRQADGKIVNANSAYARVTGYPLEELIGVTTIELGLLDEKCRADFLAAFRGDGWVHNVDSRLITKSKRAVDVLVSLEPLVLAGEACFLNMIVDISERKQMEQELRKAVAELKRANAGKDAFLAAVSHELRTPLMGITTLTDVLELHMNGTLGEREARYVHGIRDSGERLLAMVNEILRYTGLVGGRVALRPETFRLVEVCAASIRAARPKAEQKFQVMVLEVQPVDLEMHSDRESIAQILDALLDNAVKFTPNQGRIGVQVDTAGAVSVRITVWDTGIGISEEQRPYLFRPFTQVDQSLARQYGGVGLGLAYVEAMVELLGGTVAVESGLGLGSRFVVTLPCSAPVVAAGSEDGRDGAANQLDRRNLPLVQIGQ